MKISGEAPQWAIDLISQVCDDYNRTKPGELLWKPSLHTWTNASSGNCKYAKINGRQIYYWIRLKNGKMKRRPFTGRITIRYGSDERDQKLVILHELAHWIASRSKRGQSHTVIFWKKAFELYEKYGIDMDYAYNREKGYKQKATAVYERYYKP